jgi:hypothetical protein
VASELASFLVSADRRMQMLGAFPPLWMGAALRSFGHQDRRQVVSPAVQFDMGLSPEIA